MPIKAPLPLKTSRNEHAIRKFIPKNLFKAFQIISRKLQYQNPESRKLRSFKPVSQNLGTSNAKTHNTKLIGHKTSFPTQQAPSIDSQKRKSYAQNTQTAEHKNSFAQLFETHFQPTIPIEFPHNHIINNIPQQQPQKHNFNHIIIFITIDQSNKNKVNNVNNKMTWATTQHQRQQHNPKTTTTQH